MLVDMPDNPLYLSFLKNLFWIILLITSQLTMSITLCSHSNLTLNYWSQRGLKERETNKTLIKTNFLPIYHCRRRSRTWTYSICSLKTKHLREFLRKIIKSLLTQRASSQVPQAIEIWRLNVRRKQSTIFHFKKGQGVQKIIKKSLKSLKESWVLREESRNHSLKEDQKYPLDLLIWLKCKNLLL
jgi:hypothetical protein